MERNLIREYAAAELHKYQLDLFGWMFEFDTRKNWYGGCYHDQKRIWIAGWHADRDPESLVFNTVLHEIAHAIAGKPAGHGPLWKEKALLVGARPVRCETIAPRPPTRYNAKCAVCGRVYGMHKRPLLSVPYWCRNCHTPLTFKEGTPL